MRIPTSHQSKPKSGRIIFLLLGLVFLGLGTAITWFWSWPVVRDAIDSNHWVATDCRVINSQVGAHSDSDGTTYSIDIVYSYEVNGRTYQSERYDFLGGSSSGRAGKQRVVEEYPPGSIATAYVNPEDPSQAVLVVGFLPKYLLTLLPPLLAAVGIFLLGAGIGFGSRNPSALAAELDQESGELKPVARPFIKVLATASICVFWNGITSIFIWHLVEEWQAGDKQWFLAIFLVPFVLVGLFLIVLVFRTILQIANPKVSATLSPFAPRPGDVVRLNWRIRGDHSRLERLSLRLESREEITVRSGKNSRTQKTVLHESQLIETTNSHEIRAGAVNFQIPEDATPSLDEHPRKIIWEIKARAAIPSWPDVEDDFRFTVREPLGTTS